MAKTGTTDPRIDAYIAQSLPFAQPILKHLRKLVHAEIPEAEETLKWRMPSFLVDGKILCGMGAFKEHCVFGFWHKDMNATLEPSKDGDATGMSAFGRITRREDLPSDARMRELLRRAVAIQESGAPARPRANKTRAPAPRVPADLAAGMKKNRAAQATFQKLPPSGQREYVEWITEAKREETRKKRLATTLEWLAEGKSRNWKYESC